MLWPSIFSSSSTRRKCNSLSPFRRPYQQTFPCSSASSPLYYYRAWRLKLVLLYCFAASVATAAA